jgi:uncharacterized membrane protein
MTIFDGLLFILTLVTALGCGLIGGLFFAFSTSVMKALARLPSAEGIAAMQSINITIINPLFLSVFLGTAVRSALVIIASLLRWHYRASVYLLAGGGLYPVASFLVTVVFNVPKNEGLGSIAPTHPNDASLWVDYLSAGTAWNHVRTVGAFLAAASLTIELCY